MGTARVAACPRCGADIPIASPHPGRYRVTCPACAAQNVVEMPGTRTGAPQFTRVTSFRRIRTFEVVYHQFESIADHVLPSKWALLAVYVAMTVMAELLTVLVSPVAGLVVHALTLLVFLFHAAALSLHSEPVARFVTTLALLPLVRIISLTTPIGPFSYLQWFLTVGAIAFAAVLATGATLRVSPGALGLTVPQVRHLPYVALALAAGVAFGFAEYALIRPRPLLEDASLAALVGPSLLVIVLTGFTEELLFRGLIQRFALPVFGVVGAITIPALAQATLDLGFLDPLHTLLVFASGCLFGWIVHRTGNVTGVALAHGVTNVLLFLVLPASG